MPLFYTSQPGVAYHTVWYFVTLTSVSELPPPSIIPLLKSFSAAPHEIDDYKSNTLLLGRAEFNFLIDQATLETLAGYQVMWIPSYISYDPTAHSTLTTVSNLFPGVDTHFLKPSLPNYPFHRKIAQSLRATHILPSARPFNWSRTPPAYLTYDCPHFLSDDELCRICSYITRTFSSSPQSFVSYMGG